MLAEGVTHRVAVHVDENDPKVMNMALNNVQNLTNYYKSQGDTVVVEVVAYGPGLNMFIAGKSPVEQRISAMSLEMDNLTFAACGNTHRNMSQKAGKEIALVSEAGYSALRRRASDRASGKGLCLYPPLDCLIEKHKAHGV